MLDESLNPQHEFEQEGEPEEGATQKMINDVLQKDNIDVDEGVLEETHETRKRKMVSDHYQIPLKY